MTERLSESNHTFCLSGFIHPFSTCVCEHEAQSLLCFLITQRSSRIKNGVYTGGSHWSIRSLHLQTSLWSFSQKPPLEVSLSLIVQPMKVVPVPQRNLIFWRLPAPVGVWKGFRMTTMFASINSKTLTSLDYFYILYHTSNSCLTGWLRSVSTYGRLLKILRKGEIALKPKIRIFQEQT